MKWLITGLGGTLAPVLARAAQAHGTQVLRWDRSVVPPDDAANARAWLEREQPDAIAHLAVGSLDWARTLATYAAEHRIAMLFTSSAMVFHHQPDGPHRIDDARNALDPYGRYKGACEEAILDVCPQACVARIGWQIDPQQPGNNMLMALDTWQTQRGHVAASQAWRPACSFMEDTALALTGLLRERASGLVQIDSNADEGHDFCSIVQALKIVFARDTWIVRPDRDYVHDQRLHGGGSLVPPLSRRLPPLGAFERP